MLDAQHNLGLDRPNSDPFPARNDGPRGRYWTVVHTHPQAENWAASNLRRRGYETFLPLAIARRRDRTLPTLWRSVAVPLFPRYLFVIVDSHWTPVRYSPGVHAMLMSDGKPSMVQEAAVSALEAVQALPAPPTPWEPGTPCSLAAGPLAGHPAVVLDTHRRHAHVAVMLFGALQTVAVPVDCLVSRE